MKVRIVVDCGTTNLRVTLLDEQNDILAQTRRPGGVRHTAIDGHNGKLKAMLREAIEDVLAAAGCGAEDVTACIASGMITSNVGLLEIPHQIAPASAEDLHRGMRTELFPEIAPFPISFIPGVRNFSGPVDTENYAKMDMMRGEEVEAIGLWNLLCPEGECVFILPGSHNKFVRMDAQGRIAGCMTSISGELLDAITYHTIIADTVGRAFASGEEYDAELAVQGALECARNGLGRAAFAGRILNLLGGKESVRLRSYLLGAVLAQDILALREFIPDDGNTVCYIAGKAPLQDAFADVMRAMDMPEPFRVPAEMSSRMGMTGVLKIYENRRV